MAQNSAAFQHGVSTRRPAISRALRPCQGGPSRTGGPAAATRPPGGRRTEKQPTGRGPEACVEKWAGGALLVGYVPHQSYLFLASSNSRFEPQGLRHFGVWLPRGLITISSENRSRIPQGYFLARNSESRSARRQSTDSHQSRPTRDRKARLYPDHQPAMVREYCKKPDQHGRPDHPRHVTTYSIGGLSAAPRTVF